MSDRADLLWSAAASSDALEATARHAGLARSPARRRRARVEPGGAHGSPAHRIESTAAQLGIEAEPLDVAYGDLAGALFGRSPLIVVLDAADDHAVAAVVGHAGSKLLLLNSDLRIRRIGADVLTRKLCRSIEDPVLAEIDGVLARAGVPSARLQSARLALLGAKLGPVRVRGLFALRPFPNASVRAELARAGVLRRLAALLGAHAIQYGLWLLAWWVVGRAALEGRSDPGWLAAWALLLASLLPFRLLATWLQGTFAIAAGGILKQRLLAAALRQDPERVRGRGMGDFVGRVIESEAVESLALTGGIAAATAGIELVAAALVLAFAPGGIPLALALALWTALVLAAGAWCFDRRREWTSERLDLSHDLIEKMVGHRTRLVQEPRDAWHAGEDAALERYFAASTRMDRATAWLTALAPRGWLLVGVLALTPAILEGDSSTPAIAAKLGGILLAYLATSRLAHGLSHLSSAAIAWRQVVPLLDALSREDAIGTVQPASDGGSESRSEPTGARERTKLLHVKDLAFRHAGRSEALFDKLSLDVFEGDRILLEGASGCGKSTLASLLAGLRTPDGGIVLLRGVDLATLGADAWRRRIAAAPQFHENHVFVDTFAFNLLMGQRWPPRDADWKRAEELCAELGLSDLLARMPAGMNEIVGESGWQLSHGERSRLFMARALLQESDVVVLDESFAALDPATLEESLRCALRRAKTLLVIAHP